MGPIALEAAERLDAIEELLSDMLADLALTYPEGRCARLINATSEGRREIGEEEGRDISAEALRRILRLAEVKRAHDEPVQHP